MRKTLSFLMTLLLVLGLMGSLTACKQEEKTPGEKVEEAVEEAGDKIKDAADDIGDAVDEAAEEAEEAAEEIKEELEGDGTPGS